MSKRVFGYDTPEESPGLLLWQTGVTWQRWIKAALDPYHISHAQFVVLAIILWFESNSQQASQSLIIKQSKLDKMTVSKSLRALVVEGLVKRAEDEKDTRAKFAFLTTKGKTLITKLVPIVEKIDEEFFGVINKKDKQLIIDILNRLTLGNSQ